jgi:hypothetical protein
MAVVPERDGADDEDRLGLGKLDDAVQVEWQLEDRPRARADVVT